MVRRDRVRDVLHQHGFAGARRRHDQRALAFADRRDDVDNPCRKVFSGRVFELEAEALVRKQRRQIVEIDLVLGLFRIFEIERVDLQQRKIALALFRAADVAFAICWGFKLTVVGDSRRVFPTWPLCSSISQNRK